MRYFLLFPPVRRWGAVILLLIGVLLFAQTVGSTALQPDGPKEPLWRDVAPEWVPVRGERPIIPQTYRLVRLDTAALELLLAAAPLERSPAAEHAPLTLALPLPDGTLGRFQIVESPVMAPALAAKFPQIRTYAGQGLDDPAATVRLDWTPQGFHAMILSARNTIFIDPYSRGDVAHYISYYKRDYTAPAGTGYVPYPPLDPNDMDAAIERLVAEGAVSATGGQLRTYRLAVAATGEYTVYHGGTINSALAAIVTAVNRITGIYEVEVAIRMQLVANNDQIIFANAGADPYDNYDGFAMLGQNQATLDNIIGPGNYDIGHVFSTGGGGIAYLGVICESGYKAQGVTGSSAPIGDPFYVDYVAHEVGHQFGGNHTFNSTTGACGGGNRNGPTAYEPGSGSTIMAYAGICGLTDLQANSDAYFHTVSYDEIVAYTTAGFGNSCAVITSTGNTPPVADAGSGGFTIPINTPFALAGSGSDADGDTLTYNWEQFDLGPAGSPNSPSDNAPIFRTFSAGTNPARTFPRISDIVNNSQTIGELLPSYGRSLNFRLTVRDNRSGGGGVHYDNIAFSVSGSAGPFQVTAPNTAVTWTGGTNENITWNVAATNLEPVSCSTVDILLSTDGGYTYPTTLLSGTANDGSASITVPGMDTTTARVKVACASNVFFDISNTNFTITIPPGCVAPPAVADLAVAPNGSNLALSWSSTGADEYAVHLGSTPFFTPGPATLLASGPALSYEHLGGYSSTDDNYYLVVAQNLCGLSAADSNRAGKVRFDLTPGQ